VIPILRLSRLPLLLTRARLTRALVVVLLAANWIAAGPAARGDDSLPGHSRYGEAFDRGPRHNAYRMGGTGKIRFPVSSKDPLVQKFIEQGIGQLHGFWFVEAERSFRQAAKIDPNCAVAYWGMSLANQTVDPARARQFAAAAARHKAGLSDRERLYLEALDNDAGYQKIIARYPDDLEAKGFEVWRLWDKYEHGDSSETVVKTADQLMRAILSKEPMHPIHHAMLHFGGALDDSKRVLVSAAKCGESAPSIGHMWHMATHAYYPRKDYVRAAWQLEASIRTENAHAMHDWIPPSHLYAHNNEWLIRTLLRLGRVHEAQQIAVSMIDMPRSASASPVSPATAALGDDSKQEQLSESHVASANYGRDRLIQVLREFEYWNELGDLRRAGYLAPSGSPIERAAFHSSLGIVSYCRGDVRNGDRELEALRELRDEILASAPIPDAEALRSETTSESVAADGKLYLQTSEINRSIEILEKHRRVLTAVYVSRPTLIVALSALVVFAGAGVWLLRRRFIGAAVVALGAVLAGIWVYQRHVALLDLPYDGEDMDVAVVCRKLLEAGDPAEAVWVASNIAMERQGEVRPQANLVEMSYKAGKKDEARAEFEKLRELAGAGDLDSPPLARLEPIAREFGFPADWRLRQKIERSLAGLRPLESLGPLLWAPPAAPIWKLKDATGREHSLAEFRGKPVVMLFFLGAGCSHCQAQLAAFAKESARLAAAGWTVVAISSDGPEGVKKLLTSYKPDPFPFLMLADPGLTVFQAYRTYDDFEQIALHGTFLIDADGFVRWNDVGAEPFMDVPFAMAEFNRLISEARNPKSE
jgi:peroxiredoxin/tetratricopeptide (TPR) repeat protein